MWTGETHNKNKKEHSEIISLNTQHQPQATAVFVLEQHHLSFTQAGKGTYREGTKQRRYRLKHWLSSHCLKLQHILIYILKNSTNCHNKSRGACNQVFISGLHIYHDFHIWIYPSTREEVPWGITAAHWYDWKFPEVLTL